MLPAGWKGIHVERIWAHGEGRSLTAVAGAPGAIIDGPAAPASILSSRRPVRPWRRDERRPTLSMWPIESRRPAGPRRPPEQRNSTVSVAPADALAAAHAAPPRDPRGRRRAGAGRGNSGRGRPRVDGLRAEPTRRRCTSWPSSSSVRPWDRGPPCNRVGAFVVYDLLFTAPRFTLVVEDPKEWLDLVLSLILAIVVGRLAALGTERAAEASRRQRKLPASSPSAGSSRPRRMSRPRRRWWRPVSWTARRFSASGSWSTSEAARGS